LAKTLRAKISLYEAGTPLRERSSSPNQTPAPP
jgi:hypothetical protein